MPPDPGSDPNASQLVIPLHAEFAEVTRQTQITGTVRVETSTHIRNVDIAEALTDETATVERISINRRISEQPEVRHEGDTIIVPVVEEQIVIERHLFLKEEIRITRQRETRPFHETVALRTQVATVTREKVATPSQPHPEYTIKP